MPEIPPIPRRNQVEQLIKHPQHLHPGLLFDRFFPCWENNNLTGEFKIDCPTKTLHDFCSDVTNLKQSVFHPQLLEEIHNRQEKIRQKKAGITLKFTTTGPLALGLGNSHPIENGFVFDRACGTPYLPGPAIKGICRAWARICNQEELVNRLMGLGDDTKADIGSNESSMGELIFLDGYPTKWPELEVDVICNHHPLFYRSPGDKRRYNGNPDNGPSAMDIESPIPIFHLALKEGCPFSIRILPNLKIAGAAYRHNSNLKRITGILVEALEYLGIGARTAVGYGTMSIDSVPPIPPDPIDGNPNKSNNRWVKIIIEDTNLKNAREIVLLLGHRSSNTPKIEPTEWQDKPVIHLSSPIHGEETLSSTKIETGSPNSNDEYKEIQKDMSLLREAINKNCNQLDRLLITGFAPLGIAGLIGKCWHRGSGPLKLVTWNSYEKEEWSVRRENPGLWSPEKSEHLKLKSSINLGGDDSTDAGDGNAVVLGHFVNEDQFQDALAWSKKNQERLKLKKIIHLTFPRNITAENVRDVAIECAGSFAWARQEISPIADTLYWFSGLPMAIMPLVVYLSSPSKKIFIDYDKTSHNYVEAFEF
ncbi:MAG: type III-B CRISPR module RAMP protein Cmr6 [Desulfobacterium sp.]